MAANKSKEAAWKIAAIDCYIEQQQELVSQLDAKVKALPASECCRFCWGCAPGSREANPRCERCGGAGIPYDRDRRLDQLEKSLANARLRLAELKKQKRRPGTLLTLAHTLDTEGFERLKRFPKGSEDVLVALEAEKQRIESKHGTVAAYFARGELQREKAGNGRVKFDERRYITMRELVSELARHDRANPKALWPRFYAVLEQEVGSGNCRSEGDGEQSVYHYKFNGKRWRKISFVSFRKLVPIVRKDITNSKHA